MVREPYRMRLSTPSFYPAETSLRFACSLFLVITLGSLISTAAYSQNPEQGKVVPAGEGKPAVGPDGKPIDPNAKPADPNAKPADPNAKPADTGIKVIRRTEYLKTPSTSEKFNATVGTDGKVEFHFEGTPWPPVLDWLAEISGKSLDWQELPGDVLNLHTQRRYTPEEARDLLNWHLLARGFTLLLHDEVFTVANVKGINPGIVPRVTEEELATRMPSEFVKISLPLEWIIAEDAATQLAPMLSPNGRLSAIKSVNRIEAIDAVSNLRDIVTLLRDEQNSRRNDRALVRVFKLQHVRADEVIVSLMSILGIEKKQVAGGGGNMNAMMQQMQMQMQQQMQQMQQQQGGAAGAQKATEPKLVLNSRENSILATAPPDKMEIIEQTVKALDISPDSEGQLLRNLDRMRVYRLTTLKPEPLAEILTDVGNLSPGARIRIDKENNSIVLFGALSDHVTVQALVQKLDGSGRTFAVIPLRRLQAEEVAGSIQFMMGPEKKEETQRSRWSYYDYFGGNQETTRKDERPFRVDADVENNRLLVWANEIEMKEVQGLLEKLGEIPGHQSNPNTSRTIDFSSPEEAARTLKQLKQLWPHMAPNKLLSPEDGQAVPPESAPETQKKPAAPKGNQNRDATIRQLPPVRLTELETVQVEKAATPTADRPAPRHPLSDDDNTQEPTNEEASSAVVPPIAVQQLPDGRVIIGSDDTAALDQLEQLVQEIRPKNEDFRIFHLKNANTWAYGIEMNLKDFFETEENDKTFLDWYGDVVTTKDKTPNRLSKRRKLKIISDSDSHTILVQNATAEQLTTIERLIAIYDRPETNDPRAVRLTRTFGLKYSQASVIAETVKSVYRDLLSSNDPSLQNKGDGKQQPQAGPSTSYVFGRSSNNDDKKDEPKDQPIRFKGLLSIGVDEISNTIVVSAASGLMEDISHLIESLDEAAKPTTTFQVVPLSRNVDASVIQEKLGRMIEAGRRPKIKVSSSGERSNGQGQNPGTPQAAPAASALPGQ